MNIYLLESAANDLILGYRFYEKLSEGLGQYFIDSLFSDIESLKLHAGIHPKFYSRYYRALSKRFPFAIYYIKKENDVIVYGILDCRTNPTWIRKRLTNE